MTSTSETLPLEHPVCWSSFLSFSPFQLRPLPLFLILAPPTCGWLTPSATPRLARDTLTAASSSTVLTPLRLPPLLDPALPSPSHTDLDPAVETSELMSWPSEASPCKNRSSELPAPLLMSSDTSQLMESWVSDGPRSLSTRLFLPCRTSSLNLTPLSSPSGWTGRLGWPREITPVSSPTEQSIPRTATSPSAMFLFLLWPTGSSPFP